MSRRRYLSTEISLDTDVDELAQKSDFAALLYTWMIPHVNEDATISGNPKRILAEVLPHRRDKAVGDIQTALDLMEECGLFESYDRCEQVIFFPVDSFYKYQSNINIDKRRSVNSKKQQETARNATSLSLSLSSSLSPSAATTNSEEESETPVQECARLLSQAYGITLNPPLREKVFLLCESYDDAPLRVAYGIKKAAESAASKNRPPSARLALTIAHEATTKEIGKAKPAGPLCPACNDTYYEADGEPCLRCDGGREHHAPAA